MYIQAALHAGEVPGLLVVQHLLAALTRLEQDGELIHRVTVSSWANPVGMNQHVMGHLIGRFDLNGTGNFDRQFFDLRPAIEVSSDLTGRGGASDPGIRAWLKQITLARKAAVDSVEALKLQLLDVGFEHDAVLDLHCDKTAVMHIYSSWEFERRATALARSMKARALILEDEAGGGTFDQAFRDAWRALKRLDMCADKSTGFAAVVELRGQRDVSDDLAAADAAGLIDFLRSEGIVTGAAVPTDVTDCHAPLTFSLNAVSHVATSAAGLICWKQECGAFVERGQTVAEIVDYGGRIAAGRATIAAPITGFLVARANFHLATVGQRIAMIAGTTALPERVDGSLLHD
ncbi:succinylglutamate desuccinylase/aspartoacylase family protein [Caballeronia sp. RCC_10]|uniref:succinylglutamate desuccinylase/aspartoacylase domain-containing protein n=1 Tax=Caballeronia sp. RCC_10 TaxID=3239227 RepID=UPI00352462A1